MFLNNDNFVNSMKHFYLGWQLLCWKKDLTKECLKKPEGRAVGILDFGKDQSESERPADEFNAKGDLSTSFNQKIRIAFRRTYSYNI